MNRLAELLPFNAGETVASYCSRLAATCGYRHARSFGFDLSFRFQGLAIGDEPELEKFASILDVSASSLSPGAVVTNGHMNVLACEKLTRSHMERQRLRFCPFCVQDDERDKGGRRGFRSYGRLSWLVKPIRACRHHGARLITSDRKMHPMFIMISQPIWRRKRIISTTCWRRPHQWSPTHFSVMSRHVSGAQRLNPRGSTPCRFMLRSACARPSAHRKGMTSGSTAMR
ncbi:TniQ family protein [Pseudaminobacter sp. 19-2017]|uniref:TniQ family protein n=1 Tax=Pseudaminobacter soli (ex Zhang et al. 2022) TaxID=2831468 RepID=A0A942DXV6_9HYPH|nr:TniQ family protein [Pseudaminobacter soli]